MAESYSPRLQEYLIIYSDHVNEYTWHEQPPPRAPGIIAAYGLEEKTLSNSARRGNLWVEFRSTGIAELKIQASMWCASIPIMMKKSERRTHATTRSPEIKRTKIKHAQPRVQRRR